VLPGSGVPAGPDADLGPPEVLPRRTGGSGLADGVTQAPADAGGAVVLRTSVSHGSERDPAFLRRVLAGLRRL
jgi:hypothetical protein